MMFESVNTEICSVRFWVKTFIFYLSFFLSLFFFSIPRCTASSAMIPEMRKEIE